MPLVLKGADTGIAMCLSHCPTVKRRHDQDNSNGRKHLTGAYLHGTAAVAERYIQVHGLRERETPGFLKL